MHVPHHSSFPLGLKQKQKKKEHCLSLVPNARPDCQPCGWGWSVHEKKKKKKKVVVSQAGFAEDEAGPRSASMGEKDQKRCDGIYKIQLHEVYSSPRPNGKPSTW